MDHRIVFYEKTGCKGNAKQKRLLQREGISFEVKSILDTPWTKQSLEAFFVGLTKEQIVNPFAPKVKSAEIDIAKLSKDQLIEHLVAEPILIKRPLLEIDEAKICGFDIEKLNSMLQINLNPDKDIQTCQSTVACDAD